MAIQPMGRLSLRTRPQEVVHWGHQRNSVPSIADIGQFHQNWIVWWGSCHWGQGVVSWSSTSQVHHKGMDKVSTTSPPGLSQLHLKFPLLMCLQFACSNIFKHILSVFKAYYMCITPSTSQVSMWCAHSGHRDHIFSPHLEFSH